MTFTNSMPSFEELCSPSHAGELWKEEGGKLDEIWIACSQCQRELPGPPSRTEAIALGRALTQGWMLRRNFSEFPLPETFGSRDLLDGSSCCLCPRCSVEFATSL